VVAVDTNVLVRFLTRDEPRQAARSAKLLLGREVWVSKTVLLETEWVLRGAYHFEPETVLAALRGVAGSDTVQVEDPAAVEYALHLFELGFDFADALHLASVGPAEEFATFDKRLVNRGKRHSITAVSEP
jgi:predicted nucleic-acid-binding protein